MKRIIAIALTASLVAIFAVSGKAAEVATSLSGALVPTTPMAQPYRHGSYYPPAHAWPRMDQGPAIAKTLQNVPFYAGPAMTDQPDQNVWQQPTLPPAHLPNAPVFSHPQQGYYPREGHVPQAPGYEYDFGGAGSYPPTYPMEGANWRAPKTADFAKRSGPQSYATNGHRYGTYLHCPH